LSSNEYRGLLCWKTEKEVFYASVYGVKKQCAFGITEDDTMETERKEKQTEREGRNGERE